MAIHEGCTELFQIKEILQEVLTVNDVQTVLATLFRPDVTNNNYWILVSITIKKGLIRIINEKHFERVKVLVIFGSEVDYTINLVENSTEIVTIRRQKVADYLPKEVRDETRL